jgi:hypothetical protein
MAALRAIATGEADDMMTKNAIWPGRIGEPFPAAVILGVLLWGRLFLRDERVHHLIPLKR